MQFHENPISDGIQIEFDATGVLQINQTPLNHPVCIIGNHILPSPCPHWQELNISHFDDLFTQHGKPEIIIIGTGKQQHFLHPKITAQFAAHNISIEYMNTASACRTLLILQNEERQAWAWLEHTL